MLNNYQRIQVLNEALPLIGRLSKRTIVVKYGGAAMKSMELKVKVMNDVLFLSSLGVQLVLVHGGGPMIDMWLKRYDIEPKFINGIRITDEQTMEIVEMVLSGRVNRDLVALLNQKKSCAVGLSGKDGNLIVASPLFDSPDNFVGKVKCVNIELVKLLLSKKYIPVIASVAVSDSGNSYNINADIVASSIAAALSADKLILLTDTPGILSDIHDPKTLISHLNIAKIKVLKEEKIISGGMIPKVNCAINALQSNVKSVHIIDGRVEHSLLLEVLTNTRIGSMLTL